MMRAAQVVIAGEHTGRDKGKQAVELALSGHWAQAADLNREIVQDHPEDVEAHNRLGKSLSEIGSIAEAVAAFSQALSLSPHNPIARKNLQRLSGPAGSAGAAPRATGQMGASPAGRAAGREETGKFGVVPLINLTDPKIVSQLTPGDAVELASAGNVVKVINGDGASFGQVEHRLGARISRLMAGGNGYQAAVKDADGVRVTLLIRETYQHPSQIGVVSFPMIPRNDVSAAALETAGPSIQRNGAIKDWSDDDTEPGEDEVFAAPDVHKIINSPGEVQE
jgi:hypothetical protein